jgi:hypothetical protein
MNIKRLTCEDLQARIPEVLCQIEKARTRISKPPAFKYYNPREDLALVTELNKYLVEIKTEIKRRTVALQSKQD